MHDILHRTGPYLHAPDDLLRLRFETGGTPRVFTLLIASAIERDQIDRSGAGLVVLDEDEGLVLLDRHQGSGPGGAGSELYRISSMGWADFSEFCRTHPRFRGGSPDIDTAHEHPLPGSRRRQEALRTADIGPVSAGDLRSDLMRRADADPSCPIRFPARDRKGVLDDLVGRIVTCPTTGSAFIGWAIRFPEATDLTGLSGPHRVDRSMDPAWSELLYSRPELLEEARVQVLDSLVSGRLSTWGVGDEGRYDLRPSAIGGQPAVLLHGLDGEGLRATTPDMLAGVLARMPDIALRDLWKLSRTMDHETGPHQVESGLGAALNRIRSEVESSTDPDLSPSGP
jgi:hypothetical protein